MDCHNCQDEITNTLWCSMSVHRKSEDPFSIAYFHMKCFEEIAGKDYLDDLCDIRNTNFEDQLVGGLTKGEIGILKSGQKIQAIKAVRQRTGYGLKEAKDLVDAYPF